MYSLSVPRRSTRPLRTCTSRGRNRRQWRTLTGRRSGLLSKRHAVVDISGLPMRLALTTGKALAAALYSRCWPALKSGAMLVVDLWLVVMMLSGSERSTVRTAQLTGKHPSEPNPERVDLNGARNPVGPFFNKIEQRRRFAMGFIYELDPAMKRAYISRVGWRSR